MLHAMHRKALVPRAFLLLAWLMLPISAGGVWLLEQQLIADPVETTQNTQADPQVSTPAPAQESHIQGLKDAILQGQGQALNHEPGHLPSPGGQVIMRVKRQLPQKVVQEISVRRLPEGEASKLEQFYTEEAKKRQLTMIQKGIPSRSKGISLLFGRDDLTLRVLLLERNQGIQVVVEYSYVEKDKPDSP